ncbi:MAG: hypothetical protein K1000chlam2_00436 [Chlamydiae bacterium]|nr:hypothetical protein [Chlamydiota bacterium]
MDQWITIHASLAYFALAMTFISVWVKRSPWIWGPFLLFALILGYFAKILTPIAFAPIGALLILHTLLKGDIRGLARFVLVAVTTVVSVGLLTHYFPGFHNIRLFDKVPISPHSYPVTLWLSFDKPFIALFILALGFPLVANLREFGNVLKVTLPLMIGGVVLLALLGLFSGLIAWDPKFPQIFWAFALINLFVCIVEEAFWRGFIQNEFFRWFGGKGFVASISSVFITALPFAALHYFWVPNLPFLGLVFVAGIIYGSIYQFTRALEASIFTHWVFNLTHFLLFTYPLLRDVL